MSLKYPEYRVAADVLRYQTRVRTLNAWKKLFTGQVNLWNLARVLLLHARTVVAGRGRDVVRAVGVRLKDDLGQELNALAAKRGKMSFVFAAQDPGLPLLEKQGGAAFRRLRRRERLIVRLIDRADHTFTNRHARRELIDILAEELERPAR